MEKGRSRASKGARSRKSGSGRPRGALRAQAEKELSARNGPAPEQDFAKEQHELDVHRIELRMQNEALLDSQVSLAESRERYADLYDYAPIGYFTFDRKGIIADVNLTGASLLGLPRDQLREKPFTLFVAPPSQDIFRAHYRNVLKRGTAVTCELEITGKGSTSFWALVQSVPVTDTRGGESHTAVRSVISDITERKRMEEEKTRLEEQLRQSQKMEAVGTLAGGIAHDFNNILAAIIGFTELCIDDAPQQSLIRRNMTNVLKAGVRGRELIKQILAFSRKTEGQRKRIRLTPVVKETHALLRSSLPSTVQMELVAKTANDYVVADPTQVEQILMNLATNAADAMRGEGGSLTTTLASVTLGPDSSLPDLGMQPGAYVQLTVKDTGKGMTGEVRQRIFEPFFTTKEPGKGTGMGLAVVYGLVKSYDGAITVQSEVGKGSTFEVFLPQAPKAQAVEEETSTILTTGTERVLFVDDEELLLAMGQDILERLGYRVTIAENGTEAWNLFLEDPSRFDLVVTDQTMRDMTGLVLAQKMLKVRKELPIVLCTGYSEMVSAEKAEEVGIRAFVMKPMMRKELAETMRRVLDQKETGRGEA